MIPYHLGLDYTLGVGWLAPFVEGLQHNQAMAMACTSCDRVSFPPVRACPCGGTDGTWRQLEGTAQIILRTQGADGAFGLVRFDGATTHSVVRLDQMKPDATHGRLIGGPSAQPRIVLGAAYGGRAP